MIRVLLAVTTLALGCSAPMNADPLPFPEASPTAAPAPSQFGPYPVGVRTVVLEDTGRRKPDGSPRRLVTELWYPSLQSTRGQPTAQYDLMPVFTAEQQAAIGSLPLLETAAVRDVEPTRAHGRFPLVVFCHGLSAIRWQSTFYTVLLASHGYVVASVDHEGGTLADTMRGQLQGLEVGLQTRQEDVTFLLSRLERLRPDDPLYGVMDFDRIGVTGHSFGALTSMRVAALDARVKAIVPQAPVDAEVAWVGVQKPVHLGMPVLIQGAHEDKTLPWDTNVATTMAVLDRPNWLLDLVKGGHYTFSDLCGFDLAAIIDRVHLELPNIDVKKVLQDGCGPTAPPVAVAHPVINHFAVAFFNAHFKGSAGSLALMTQAQADAVAGETGVAVFTAAP